MHITKQKTFTSVSIVLIEKNAKHPIKNYHKHIQRKKKWPTSNRWGNQQKKTQRMARILELSNKDFKITFTF